MKFTLKDSSEHECTNIFILGENDLRIQWTNVDRSEIYALLSDTDNLNEITFNGTKAIGFIQPTYIQEQPLKSTITVNLIRKSSEEIIQLLEKRLSDAVKEQEILSNELSKTKSKMKF
ncbi:MAG: hypothetical protein ACOYBL_12210 [Lachnospiraceae bacterium]|jgi:hypothetical protein